MFHATVTEHVATLAHALDATLADASSGGIMLVAELIKYTSQPSRLGR